MKPALRTLAAPMVAVGLLAPALTVPLAVPTAAAEPTARGITAPGQPPVPTPPITFGQLGLGDQIDLIGADQPVELALPVPAGVGPLLLTGTSGTAANTADARVDVLDSRGTSLGSFPATAAPFQVDISRAAVSDGRAVVTFVLRQQNTDAREVNSCTVPATLTLSGLATTFSDATAPPTSVAGFLPGYLDRIVIRVGARPSVFAQQAALDLVAQLTHTYRPMPVRIDVTGAGSAPEPLAAGTTGRVIELRDGGAPGATVERPGSPDAVLVLSGTGEELLRQVSLFADERLGLAQTPAAVTLAATSGHPKATTLKTFAELGTTGETSVLGRTTLYAGFDATAFGVGPISDATVHLKAHYTPVTDADATVVIRSGGTILGSATLDDSGVLDLTGTIPAETITTDVGLALELRYFPHQQCAPMDNRLTFAIDGQSTVSVTPGTVNRGGFPVLPMAFSPQFDVAVDNPDDIGLAAQAINLMGEQTSVTLRPHLTSLSDATGTGTGLLVVTGPDGFAAAGLTPPLLPTDPDTFGINPQPSRDGGSAVAASEVDLHGPLGIVQTFGDGDRSVLAISGDPTLVGRTFDDIRGRPDRWGSLTGDVLATGVAGDTVNLTVSAGGSMAHQPVAGPLWRWWALLSVAVCGAAAAAAATVLVLRRRRSTRP